MNSRKSSGTFNLVAHGDREIVITRVFDAPLELVFDAWTKPELLKRWFGVRGGWSLAVCEIDLRMGGAYRFVWRSSKGELAASGVYREVAPPERLVNTEKFDDPWYTGECLDTFVFVERAGKTTATDVYETPAARDGVMATPLGRGVAESYDVLDELLAAQAA